MSDASPPPLPPTEPFRPEPTERGTTTVLDEPISPPRPPSSPRRRTITILATIGAVLALIVAAAVGYWSGNDDDEVDTAPSTTVAPTTSTPVTEQPSTTVTDTTAATTTTVASPAPVDTTTAIFPYASGTVRYDDPVDAARGFAVVFAGFTDPVIGAFMQGDNRSGEVEIRPAANGPVTLVFVRQLDDDAWWVLGAVTDNIDVDRPPTGSVLTSPVAVSGTALAFEGHVNVEVRQDDTTEPLGTGFVTGGGGPAAPFHGQIGFTAPTQQYGAMLFLTRSEENGEVWEVAAYRIRFA